MTSSLLELLIAAKNNQLYHKFVQFGHYDDTMEKGQVGQGIKCTVIQYGIGYLEGRSGRITLSPAGPFKDPSMTPPDHSGPYQDAYLVNSHGTLK